jgi:BlaI family transcriptional regulator, penicillinase repressor
VGRLQPRQRPKRPARQAATRGRKQDFQLRGPLQVEVMAVLWKLGTATVSDIRAEQPRAERRAYTTVQTVLDRLVDRGLVERERRGKPYVYRARYDEAELLARSISQQLAATSSPESRRDALLRLVEESPGPRA